MRRNLRSLLVSLIVTAMLLAGCGGGAPAPANSNSGQPTGGGGEENQSPSSSNSDQEPAPVDNGEILIGTLWPLSGALAAWGNDNLRGATVAVDIVNDRGGINGKKIRLINADNTSNPSVAATEANRLISQEGLKIIVGTVISSGAMAASEVAEKNKVIYWEANGLTNELTRRDFKYLFRVVQTANSNATTAAEFIKEQIAPALGTDIKDLRIAITYEDSAYGTSIAEAMEEALGQYGAEPIAAEAYSAKANDLSSLVLKLKNLKTDVLFNAGYLGDMVIFWKQAEQLDLQLKALVGGGGWSLQYVADGVGSTINGVFDSSTPPTVNPAGLAPEARELHAEFLDRYARTHNAPVTVSSFQGFAAMWVLLDVLAQTGGDTDPDKVREAALALDLPEGSTVIGWGVKFNEEGQNTRAFAGVMQWQDNKLGTVWPKRLSTIEPNAIPLPTWQERR